MKDNEISKLLEKSKIYIENNKTLRLRQEASARSYYRIFTKSIGQEKKSFIFCYGLPQPYQDDDNFIKIAKLLAKNKIPVPKVIKLYPKEGALLLSDLGDIDLSQYIQKKDTPKKQEVLCQAIDILLEIQKIKVPRYIKAKRFDKKKLYSEFQYLFDILKDISQIYKRNCEASFECKILLEELCGFIEASTKKWIFVHRDYHSRNIMLEKNKHIGILDFQDARIGHSYYDLASLVCDPYLFLSYEIREGLLVHYQNKTRKEINTSLFYCIALQRLLKTLGTYLVQIERKKNYHFLPSVNASISFIKEIIGKSLLPDHLYFFIVDLEKNLKRIYPCAIMSIPTKQSHPPI